MLTLRPLKPNPAARIAAIGQIQTVYVIVRILFRYVHVAIHKRGTRIPFLGFLDVVRGMSPAKEKLSAANEISP
jgi:hypothetical protein